MSVIDPPVSNWSAVSAVTASAAVITCDPKTTRSGIEIEEHAGYWTVVDPDTGIFGSGPDESMALEDFFRALREHLDVLSRQEHLSEALNRQLEYLRQLLS